MSLLAKLLSRIQDGLNLLLVPGTAAVVGVHRQAHLVFCWFGVFVKQGFGGDDGTRDAVATLSGTIFNEGFLQGMGMGSVSDSANCGHRMSIDPRCKCKARRYRMTIH
jgi:hypothetical protein